MDAHTLIHKAKSAIDGLASQSAELDDDNVAMSGWQLSVLLSYVSDTLGEAMRDLERPG